MKTIREKIEEKIGNNYEELFLVVFILLLTVLKGWVEVDDSEIFENEITII